MLHGIAWPREAKLLSFVESCHGARGSLAGAAHWDCVPCKPGARAKDHYGKTKWKPYALFLTSLCFFFLKKQN